MDLTRQQFLKGLAFAAAAGVLPRQAIASDNAALQDAPATSGKLTVEDLKAAQKSVGCDFSEDELKAILQSVQGTLDSLPDLRKKVDNWELAPAMAYRVPTPAPKKGTKLPKPLTKGLKRPKSDEDIAFLSACELSELLRTKQITSIELTKLYLSRLKTYGPKLHCVAAITEERALKEAAEADKLFAQGKILSPLQGIPYGVKDLFAAKGYPTQWGSSAYIGQSFDQDSDVVQMLTRAGAVLVAKLSLGALAMNDVWYEGKTQSPWNPKIGSSGSSAGSASATAAGLVGFSIGTETSGSIVSPSHNCRVVGLRPTFGSVSRAGGMTLCWSLDKAGPICRTADDCALVFAQILGASKKDLSSVDRGFEYRGKLDPAKARVGYLVNSADLVGKSVDTNGKPHLEALASMGAKITAVYIPPAPDAMDTILSAECAASFDSFTNGEKAHVHKENEWPQIFRAARFVSAVDYIQADRYRVILEREYSAALAQFDVVVADDRLYPRVYALNCTGHPQVLVPLPMGPNNAPRSCSLIGNHFNEGPLLGLSQTLIEHFKLRSERPNMSQWQ